MKPRSNHAAARHAGRCLAAVLAAACLAVTTLVPARAHTGKAVIFGHARWPGVTVKTQVVADILRDLGYKTRIMTGAQPVMLNGLRRGDIDIDMEAWRPSQNTLLNKLIKTGHVTQVAANIEAARFGLAVPAYVYKAGVHSLADLHKYPGRFGRKVYGIAAGDVGNQIIKKAIRNNTYNLHGWRVVPSSTSGMLTQVGKEVRKKQWIVFLGWAPHWMNVVYNIRYLNDPRHLFGKQSTVYTMANTAFLKSHPNVARFLRQIRVTLKDQNRWIYRYGYKNVKPGKVARTWIRSHLETVSHWLDGVTTQSGARSAIKAVRAQTG